MLIVVRLLNRCMERFFSYAGQMKTQYTINHTKNFELMLINIEEKFLLMSKMLHSIRPIKNFQNSELLVVTTSVSINTRNIN